MIHPWIEKGLSSKIDETQIERFAQWFAHVLRNFNCKHWDVSNIFLFWHVLSNKKNLRNNEYVGFYPTKNGTWTDRKIVIIWLWYVVGKSPKPLQCALHIKNVLPENVLSVWNSACFKYTKQTVDLYYWQSWMINHHHCETISFVWGY